MQPGALESGTNRQMYLPETNVLMTRFLRPEGVGEVLDFMPVRDEPYRGRSKRVHEIIRTAKAVRGAVRFRFECAPAFDYARREHQVESSPGGAIFRCGATRLQIVTEAPLRLENKRAVSEFVLHPGKAGSLRCATPSQKPTASTNRPTSPACSRRPSPSGGIGSLAAAMKAGGGSG